nr:hypothetical protein [uncultured Desulfobacter sp.]
MGKSEQKNSRNGGYIPNGYMMMDLMVAMLLLAIAVGPMINAFFPSFAAMNYERRTSVMTAGAMGTLNRVAALCYETLNANLGSPANLSALLGSVSAATQETVVFNGQAHVPVVTVTDYSGGVGGLLEITVTLDTIVFKTLKAQF